MTGGDVDNMIEISSIASDTSLTIVNNWPFPTVTGTNSFFIINFSRNIFIRDLTIQNCASSGGILSIDNAADIFVENVRVYSNGSISTRDGIQTETIIDCVFVNCESSFNTDGFFLENSRRTTLINCIATGNAGDGFDLNGNTEESNLYSCVSDGNTGDGYESEGANVNYYGCRAMGNDGNGFFLEATSHRNNLVGCWSIDNASDGVEIETDDCSISGGFFKNNDAYG